MPLVEVFQLEEQEAARGATSARIGKERFFMVVDSSVGRQSYEPAIPGDGARHARQA